MDSSTLPQKTACKHLSADNLKNNPSGSLVYKDQCGKCFHDPRDTQGLDICLKCYGGFCAHNHSDQHCQQLSHPIVLNYKLIEKVKTEEEEKQESELTKLAIGKPGGANIQQEEYIELFQLRCKACNIDLDNSLLEDIVKKVSKEDSAFKKNDICEWELEILPCEHTLTLEQVPKDLSQGLSHCHQCELSSNLWLCLVCGNVGCGRKNYDGTGGNNHAIDHSKSHGHPLVVKLGTITQEGNASIYCYSCDNDVRDSYLSDHLGQFGINISEQEKTEKTVMEMNLDLNKTLTLSSILEEGKLLKQIFGSRRTGMQNIGNSCYINSVFQTLFALPEFEDNYLQKGAEHLKTCQKFAVNCLTCQISKLVCGLVSGDYSQKQEVKIMKNQGEILPEEQRYHQQGIAINDLRKLIGKDHQEFKTKQMQDALEYLQYFFDLLDKEQTANKEQLKLSSLFEHKTINKLQCQKCLGVKLVETKTNEFKLPIIPPTAEQIKNAQSKNLDSEKPTSDLNTEKSKVDTKLLEEPEYEMSFQQSIDLVKQGEMIELNCPKCSEKSYFKSTVLFKTTPQYLIVPTQRLILENWVPKKLNANIKMPSQYDFKDLCYQGLSKAEILLESPSQSEKAQISPAFQIDEMAYFQLLEMGFGENRAKRALKKFNNNSESAMNYLFENYDDQSLDLPIQDDEPNNTQKQQSQLFIIDQDNLQLLQQMGFNSIQCTRALKKFNNNVELALDGLSCGDYYEEEEEQQQQQKIEEEDKLIESTNYELIAAIVHLGKSTHAGHYITYVKRDNEWIYYNDSKVATSIDPSLGKGYIYLFKQK